jgi:hypothetical protein
MTSDQSQVEDGLLSAFESKLHQSGQEAAFRLIVQIKDHETALRTKAAWEKKVKIIESQSGPATLRRSGIGNWYAGPAKEDRCWPALAKYLVDTKRWSPETVKALDDESTGVMKLLPHPGGEINAKGLVVGYVQSGKTANYTALIAKAADVGYRLIIVLAGIHNGLRRQTQERLQAELIELDPQLRPLWHTLTQPTQDFRGATLNPDAFLVNDQRILAVVKKNGHVLGRLVKWLQNAQERSRAACPTLIIDDEADQAGLNTSKDKDERTKVNQRILDLKACLPRSAYVGYTATPFANVLVNPSGDDLYPEDFITSLNRPKGYFGTELFFGRDAVDDDKDDRAVEAPDMFRQVSDDEVALLRPASREEVPSFSAGMPGSLAEALRYFLLATCARWVRGQQRKHSSMLVHTALNPAVHRSLQGRIEKEIAAITKSLKTEKTRRVFAELWAQEHPRVTHPGREAVAFDALWPKLPDVLQRTKIIEDNGQSDERLLYKTEVELTDDDPVAHIAVGGNTLSRGLTLEGLVVSYFVRSASTYDTLLQMGRWFGYRFGYEDLPRLWMTRELRDAFHDLATIEEEVRRDIARYARDGLTPREFAVRIRTHPTMAVTSRLKMQYAVAANIDYAGFTRQTRLFVDDDAWLRDNWRAAEDLFERVAKPGGMQEKSGRRYATGVDVTEVRRFLSKYKFHVDHNELTPELLLRYIDQQNAQGRCKSWTVALVGRQKEGPGGTTTFAKSVEQLYLPIRSLKVRDYEKSKVDLGTMTSQDDFAVDLPESARAPSGSKEQPTRPSTSDPLLLLYPIARTVQNKRKDGAGTIVLAHDVLGVAFSFPETEGTRTGNYIQVELPKRDTYIDEEEITADGEDEG